MIRSEGVPSAWSMAAQSRAEGARVEGAWEVWVTGARAGGAAALSVRPKGAMADRQPYEWGKVSFCPRRNGSAYRTVREVHLL